MFLYWLIAVVMPLLTAACSRRTIPGRTCDCGLADNGCHIVQPAPPGFKCLCSYSPPTCYGIYGCTPMPAWCHGLAVLCRNDEACPGGRYSYCSCILGGGNCKGYRRRPSAERCPNVTEVIASSALRQYSYRNCDCDYHRYTGCYISDPAPEGFKCECYEGFHGCSGNSVGCDEDEYCPADDYSYCGCLRGGGNCGGYRHDGRDPVCDLGGTCDCDRSSAWTNGRYSFYNITYDTANIIRRDLRPAEFQTLEIPNTSDVEQSNEVAVVHIYTNELSFQRTHGVTVAAELSFSTTIPTISLTQTTTTSFTYGNKTTSSKQYSHKYTCKSAPKIHTRCRVFLIRTDETVPYTMLLKHNEIPDCVCRSFGNFRSSGSFDSRMVTEIIGPCNSYVSGKCETKNN